MPKILKYILFGVMAIIVIFLIPLIIAFFMGFFSTFNPKKSMKLAEETARFYSHLYIPQSYTLTKKAEWKQTKEGDYFITTMVK